MSSQQEFTATRLNRSDTASSISSTGSWLELSHTPNTRDARTSSVSSSSGGFLPLTTTPSRQNATRNVTDEERRLFLLRARNGN